MAAGRVQTKTGGVSGATSLAITWTSNTTSANLIVVSICTQGVAVSSITDSQSNTYTKIQEQNSAGSALNSLWYAKNITGGTTPTVTINLASATVAAASIREYSGLDTTAPLDQSTIAVSASPSTPSSGATATTSQATELVVGSVAALNAQTLGTGFSNLSTITQVTMNEALEDKDVTSTGAQTATFGVSSTSWACSVATFKEAGGGATVYSSKTMLGMF